MPVVIFTNVLEKKMLDKLEYVLYFSLFEVLTFCIDNGFAHCTRHSAIEIMSFNYIRNLL